VIVTCFRFYVLGGGDQEPGERRDRGRSCRNCFTPESSEETAAAWNKWLVTTILGCILFWSTFGAVKGGGYTTQSSRDVCGERMKQRRLDFPPFVLIPLTID
jgi:hypothetical protein